MLIPSRIAILPGAATISSATTEADIPIKISGPCILYMDEWFVKRKGLAYGIMWSGTGLAGLILPLLMEHLLGTYGYQSALRIWAVALFLLTVPLAYFMCVVFSYLLSYSLCH